jgi:phenylalanyl-tRNA synthetase beta subunit
MATRWRLSRPKWTNMENKDIQILVSMVYKAHAEKGPANFETVKSDVQALIKIIQELGGKVEVPFTNKTITNPGVCGKCGATMKVSLKSGKPYCSALCWKNGQ